MNMVGRQAAGTNRQKKCFFWDNSHGVGLHPQGLNVERGFNFLVARQIPARRMFGGHEPPPFEARDSSSGCRLSGAACREGRAVLTTRVRLGVTFPLETRGLAVLSGLLLVPPTGIPRRVKLRSLKKARSGCAAAWLPPMWDAALADARPYCTSSAFPGTDCTSEFRPDLMKIGRILYCREDPRVPEFYHRHRALAEVTTKLRSRGKEKKGLSVNALVAVEKKLS
ncbi:hypothetical protein C8R44DRAFT_847442 [Mycena epipterygia]|nr:hypothetical protein C8R44DRAFT_847442 [Mycena epipterygia]